MSVHIHIEMLACYLDDALNEAEITQVEKALRDSEPLRMQLNQLMKDRDLGDHSVGAIWRRQRLTCVPRDRLGNYLMGVLEAEAQDYITFHLQTVGCAFCLANVADLQMQQKHDADGQVKKRRKRYFESSAGLLQPPDPPPPEKKKKK